MSGEDRRRGPGEVRSDRARELERRADREHRYRRAFRAGLAVSVVVHLVVLFWLGSRLQMPDLGFGERVAERPEPAPGLRITRVRERQDEPPIPTPPPPVRPEPAPEPEPTPEPEETEGEAGPEEAAEEAEAAGGEERVDNVGALTPRQGDPRLWREFWDEDVARRYLGAGTRADSALRAILGRYLDSLRLSEEQLRRARDWTYTEEDGDRWGVSPEGIHLGDVTIPLPVGQLLQPTGPRRRELERELRYLREIQRQEAIEAAEETREERIEAMEERAREEGEEASSDTADGGGRPP